MRSRGWTIFWTGMTVVAGFYLLRHFTAMILSEGPRADLDIVIRATRRFLAQESPYRLDDLFEHTKPPLLMALVFPLAWIPHFWVRLVWDLIVFALPPLLLRESLLLANENSLRRFDWKPAALTWALLYPFWFREAGYGQFNLFIFWLLLTSSRFLRGERPALQWASGVLVGISILIKPTQLYLLPWLVLATVNRPRAPQRLVRSLAGGLLLAAVLSMIYVRIRVPGAWIADHLEWIRFLPETTSKHLIRGDNYGLPTLLARLGFENIVRSAAFFPLTIALSVWVAWLLRFRRELALDCSALMMLAFSPMCWRANFGIFVGLGYRLATKLEKSPTRPEIWTGLLSIMLFSRASEHWLEPQILHLFGVVAAPLWLMLVAIFCAHCMSGPEGVRTR